MTSRVAHKTLSEFRAFRGLPELAVARLARLAAEVEFAPGEKIVRKGEPGDCLYLIREGRAFATVPDADGVLFDDYMDPGDIFGEMSLLTGEDRAADITAASRVRCLRVPFDALRQLMTQHPDVAGFLTRVVGRRLLKRDGIREVGGFEIGDALGDGGFATVFAGTDPASGERVAIKMLRHELVWRADFARRFRNEAGTIRQLSHPHIVQVHDVVDAYATIFIVMELVEGCDLSRWLGRVKKMQAPEVRHVVRAVGSALHEAHERGVVHRDVKPSNVLATSDGQVKLADFGVALTEGSGIVDSTFTGTPQYAAPEHVLNRRMDGRTDVYMLGVTAWELLTGKTPFEAADVLDTMMERVSRELPDPRGVAEIPADLAEFIYRATRRIPSERFGSCLEAVRFLEEAGQPSVAPSVVAPVRRARPASTSAPRSTEVAATINAEWEPVDTHARSVSGLQPTDAIDLDE